MRFHDAVSVVRKQPALQPLALAVVNVRAFPDVAMHVHIRHNRLCLVFSKKFNIMSALSAHQPLNLSQKIDSREGLF